MAFQNKPKVAIIGTKGVSLTYRNTEIQTDNLVKYLSELFHVTVYCVNNDSQSKETKNAYFKAKLIHFRSKWIQKNPILYSSFALLHALFYAEVLLVFGTSSAWLFPFVKMVTKKRIVVHLNTIEWHGKEKNRIVKLFYFWLEGLAIKFSHADISGNEVIQDYISQKYETLNHVVDFGANHSKVISKEILQKMYPFLSDSYAFMKVQIAHNNMIKTILSAFDTQGTKKLVVIGNWNESEYGQYLKQKFSNSPNIFLLEPIYNQEKLDLLQSNASLFIKCNTKNYSESALLEAMYCGIPILAFSNAYNRATTENLATYFSDKKELLDLIVAKEWSEFQTTGVELQKIAQKKHTWRNTINQYVAIIEKTFTVDQKLSAIPYSTRLDYRTLLELGHAHLKSIHPIQYLP